jgi:hypothetical protein
LLTTYGFDDTALSALETRWGAWWEQHREQHRAPDPLP